MRPKRATKRPAYLEDYDVKEPKSKSIRRAARGAARHEDDSGESAATAEAAAAAADYEPPAEEAAPLPSPQMPAGEEEEARAASPQLASEGKSAEEEEGGQTFTDAEGRVYNRQQLVDLIRQLYKSPNFAGSFGGIDTMRREIFLTRRLAVPSSIIIDALNEEPVYVTHILSRKVLETQHYHPISYGDLMQCDTAHMYPYGGMNYFVLFQDLFSYKLFTFAIERIDGDSVTNCLSRLLKSEPDLRINCIQSDAGTEYINKTFQALLKKHSIVYRKRSGQHKAS